MFVFLYCRLGTEKSVCAGVAGKLSLTLSSRPLLVCTQYYTWLLSLSESPKPDTHKQRVF